MKARTEAERLRRWSMLAYLPPLAVIIGLMIVVAVKA